MVALCPTEQIDTVWDKASGLIEKSLQLSGRHDKEDIHEGLVAGRFQLWIAAVDGKIVAACISGLVPYPKRPMLNVLFLGGTQMDKWLADLIDKLKRFAVHNELNGIEFAGRKGWLRALDKFGFQDKAVLMELSFEQGFNTNNAI